MFFATLLFAVALHLLIGPLAHLFSLVLALVLFFELLITKKKRVNVLYSILMMIIITVSFRFYFKTFGDYRLQEEARKIVSYHLKNNQYPKEIDKKLFFCLFCESLKYENNFKDQRFPLLYYTLFYPFERRIYDFGSKEIRNFN